MLEDGNILRGDRLRAVLVDQNGATLVDPQTGSMPYYEFVPGGATEYTFSGCQTTDGRTVPDTTAVLPVTLLPYETEAEDVDAPDLAVTGYVMRQGKSSQIPGVTFRAAWKMPPSSTDMRMHTGRRISFPTCGPSSQRCPGRTAIRSGSVWRTKARCGCL